MRTSSVLLIGLLAPMALVDGPSPSDHRNGATVQSPRVHTADRGKIRLPAVGDDSVRVSVDSTPNLNVVGAGVDDRDRLDEAVRLFRENGLDLPDLDVHFFDDSSQCDGHYGLFRMSSSPWQIHICSDVAFVVTHELAHAWEAANLDDRDRIRYVQARGLSNWDDRSAPWGERGREDAAFIIQQNLTATNPPLTSPEWSERIAAYELLTGRPSPLRPVRHDVR